LIILNFNAFNKIENLSLKVSSGMQGAVLINASRGPVIYEAALEDHLKANPMFHVGLDMFEVIYFIRFLGTLSCGCIFIVVLNSGVCKICWFNDQVDILNEARI